MCRTHLAALFLGFLSVPAMGQSMELLSGSMTVHPGTSLRIQGPIEWTIAGPATVVNNGSIDLGTEARLIEVEGSPIVGAGTEHAVLVAAPPYVSQDPGGLGLSLSTTDGPGTVDIVRGHEPQLLHTSDLSIARWYFISAMGEIGQDLALDLRYDPSELNGLDGADLLIFESTSDTGPWGALPSTVDVGARTVSSTDQYPWAYVTAFDRNAVASVNATSVVSGFQVYPTIVESVLHINTSGEERIITLEVVDGLGRTVWSERTAALGTQARIDLSGLMAGAYFLRINSRYVHRFRKA
ncbi:MAG: T9SS type A sorting domain-containing protein [Flavobacteriales bacterium]